MLLFASVYIGALRSNRSSSINPLRFIYPLRSAHCNLATNNDIDMNQRSDEDESTIMYAKLY